MTSAGGRPGKHGLRFGHDQAIASRRIWPWPSDAVQREIEEGHGTGGNADLAKSRQLSPSVKRAPNCGASRHHGANATRISIGRPHLHGVGCGKSARRALEHVQIVAEDSPDSMQTSHRLPADWTDDLNSRGDVIAHPISMNAAIGSSHEIDQMEPHDAARLQSPIPTSRWFRHVPMVSSPGFTG